MRQRNIPYRLLFLLILMSMIGINGWSAMLHPTARLTDGKALLPSSGSAI